MDADDRSPAGRPLFGPQRPPIGHELDVPEPVARALAIAAVVGIALIHVIDAPDTYASTRYVFWLYMGLVTAGIPLITLLLRWNSSRVWLAGMAFAAGPLIGYVVSRTIGLPGDPGDVGNWLDSLGMASLFVEGALIALSLTRLGVQPHLAGHPDELHTHGTGGGPERRSSLRREISPSNAA